MRRFDLQYFSNISAIATALVAVLALVIAIWQIKAAENIQHDPEFAAFVDAALKTCTTP